MAAKVTALLKAAGNGAGAAGLRAAAVDADVVVLATPWEATRAAVKACGDLRGKVLIDCTNPYSFKRQRMELDVKSPGGRRVAAWAKGAHVVKAFNTLGANLYGRPVYGGGRISMFYCGDAKRPKAVAAKLIKQLGFDAVDCGGLGSSLWLEALCGLWLQLAPRWGWKIGFRVLRGG